MQPGIMIQLDKRLQCDAEGLAVMQQALVMIGIRHGPGLM
jgi:hypothetical protein